MLNLLVYKFVVYARMNK